MEELDKLIDKEIDCIVKDGIDNDNLDALYKMVDIKKDIKQIDNFEEESMRYSNNYGYSRGYRDGGYDEGGYGDNYGRRRRDSRGRYTGGYGASHPSLERMMDAYQKYEEANEETQMGNYSANGEKMQKLEVMLQSLVEFYDYIVKENSDPESMEMIKHYVREMNQGM